MFDNETETNTNVVITYANTESITLPYETMYQVQGYTSGVFAPNIIIGTANSEFVTGSFSVNTTNHVASFAAQNNRIVISYDSHGYLANDYVFLHFHSANAWANLGNQNYFVTSSNVSHFTVYNPLTENVAGNTGIVRVYNPDVLVNMPYGLPRLNDNVYIQFQTVDISLSNGFYQVISVKNANTFNVLHPNMTTANDAANVANLITKKIIVTANNHEMTVNGSAYILLLGGDTANTQNGYYTITQVGGANTFNITGPSVIFSESTALVYQNRSKIVIANHPFANGNAAYIAFTSGDQANTSNGIYYPIKIGADEFTINVARPATGNSNVRVWYQSNNYSNIRFTTLKADNGFSANDNVHIEFFTSSTDLANGIYMIKDEYSSNTYNIYYDGNTYIQNAFSTYGSIVILPDSTINSNGSIVTTYANSINTINAIAHSGLGIVANSVMEGIAYVSPYK